MLLVYHNNALLPPPSSGVRRLDLVHLQEKEQALHKKLIVDYWLQVEQERATVQAPAGTTAKTPKQVAPAPRQHINEVVQVQAPTPVLTPPLISDAQVVQERLTRVLVATISQEMALSVSELRRTAELREETDEELQIIMTLLLEV